eukprot:808981-Rhodomonas_salina.2
MIRRETWEELSGVHALCLLILPEISDKSPEITARKRNRCTCAHIGDVAIGSYGRGYGDVTIGTEGGGTGT